MRVPEPLQLDVEGLLDLVRPGFLDQRLSAVSGLPLVVVDLDGGASRDAAERLDRAATSALPCIFVGRAFASLSASAARVAARLDLLLAGPSAGTTANAVPLEDGDGSALDAIAAAVDKGPLASVSLTLLLRHDFYRTPLAGLIAESATYSTLQAGPEFARWLLARSAKPTHDSGERVQIRRENDTLHVMLARPARRNAIDVAMRDALHEAFLLALSEPDLRLVLSGLGRAFCAGGDLAEFGTAVDPAQAHIVRLTHSLARLLLLIGARTEARVHGACIGAGVELPAFAGHVSGAPDSFFALPEVAMGLIPGAGGTVSVARRIGRQRTLWLALSGRAINAAMALEWGLLDEIVVGG